ncbi:hypothetical protein ACWDV4_00450 [Micromonospora sp. NPDC003197]
MITHTAIPRLWLCRGCGGPWPCGTARLSLLREFAHDRVGLSVYLAGLYVVALTDLHPMDPALIYGRFLGWVPRRVRSRGEDGCPDIPSSPRR